MKYCVNDDTHEFFKNRHNAEIDLTYNDVLLKPRLTETKLAINFVICRSCRIASIWFKIYKRCTKLSEREINAKYSKYSKYTK